MTETFTPVVTYPMETVLLALLCGIAVGALMAALFFVVAR